MPGAGKTNIVRIVERRLREAGYGVATNLLDFQKFGTIRRHLMPILHLFSSWEPFVAFVKGCVVFFRLLPKGYSKLDDFHGVFTRYLVRNFLLKEAREDIYILDDGAVNRFFGVKAAEGDVSRSDPQVPFLFLKNGIPVVVLVDTPWSVAAARVLAGPPEGREYMFAMDQKEVEKFYRTLYQHMERVAALAKDMSGGRALVLTVDGTAPPEENAERIVREIEKLLPPRSHAAAVAKRIERT